jgi:hypothetical protein
MGKYNIVPSPPPGGGGEWWPMIFWGEMKIGIWTRGWIWKEKEELGKIRKNKGKVKRVNKCIRGKQVC